MAIYRTMKENGDFVTVHKSFIFDNNLSAKAKGILLYFLSRPDDWQIYTSEVVKHMNDGQKSINAGINELIKYNYVHRMQKRTNTGVFSGYEYLVYEKPIETPFSANGLSENGFSANGKTENRKGQTTNNNSTNNDLTKNNNTKNNSSSGTSATQQQPLQSINVYTFYENNGFGRLNPTIVDNIDAWKEDFNGNEDIVIEALKEAAMNNVYKWAYMNSILKNWYQDNIKTVEDIEARRKQREVLSTQNKSENNFLNNKRKEIMTQEETFDNSQYRDLF